MIISREKSSHWYLRDGTPFHEVPNKSKGGMRPVTIRDARAAEALPSVTNILSVLGKPGLEAWKLEQAILASLTLPKIEGESLEAFAQRIVEDMDAEAKAAADKGTAIHDACANFAISGSLPGPELLPFVQPFIDWFKPVVKQVTLVEDTVVNLEYGYAGRLDLKCEMIGTGPVLIDIKTQKRKAGKFSTYPEWPLQLMAYAVALGEPKADLISVMLDREEPGIEALEWLEHDDYWTAFKSALDLWKYLKGF